MSKRARLTGPVLFCTARFFGIGHCGVAARPRCDRYARGILLFLGAFFGPERARQTIRAAPAYPRFSVPPATAYTPGGVAVNGSVLVVDDEVDTAQLLRDVLRRRGLSVNS